MTIEIVYFLLTIASVLIGGTIPFMGGGPMKSRVYLAVACLFAGLFFAENLANLYFKTHFYGLSFLSEFYIAPCLYLFVHGLGRGAKVSKPGWTMLFAPALVATVVLSLINLGFEGLRIDDMFIALSFEDRLWHAVRAGAFFIIMVLVLDLLSRQRAHVIGKGKRALRIIRPLIYLLVGLMVMRFGFYYLETRGTVLSTGNKALLNLLSLLPVLMLGFFAFIRSGFLFGYIIRPPKPDPRLAAFLERAIEIREVLLDENISIDALAKASGYSRRHVWEAVLYIYETDFETLRKRWVAEHQKRLLAEAAKTAHLSERLRELRRLEADRKLAEDMRSIAKSLNERFGKKDEQE